MRPNLVRILRVDLTSGSTTYSDSSFYAPFLGGRGLNQHLLLHEMPIGISPFAPSNPVAIGPGLLCGTDAPGATRVSIDTKNVLTGGIGSSNVGGNFGPALRRAGISNLVITGRAKELCYIYIDNGKIEIRNASHLKQKPILQVINILKDDLGEDFYTMAVGPAGENLVWSACLIIDGSRAAGRSGIGAVFGAKNLKAIAVRGTTILEAANVSEFEKAVYDCREKLKAADLNKSRRNYGVYCMEEPWDLESPYRNFSGNIPPLEKKEQLTRDEFKKYLSGHRDCGSCPVGCWTVHEFRDENGTLVTAEAFQANAVHNFGAKLDMNDARDVLKAHALCDELGLDEDVTSNVIAWAFTCFEKELLTKKDADGLSLQWGNKDTVFELIRKIAYREGFGALLAEGCVRASQKFGLGSEQYCVHVKGNDLFECLWMRPAWALGVVVSPRGGTHTRGALIESRMQSISPELCMKFFGILSLGKETCYDNKEKLVVFMERLNGICDSLGMCMFTHAYTPDMLLPDDYARLLSAFVGEHFSGDKLLLVGEQIHTIEKCLNVLHTDWTRKDDMPPSRFLEIPLAGTYQIDLEKWNSLLDRYYMHHGWNLRTGWPTKETLTRLGLHDVLSVLEDNGRIV